MRTIIQGVIVVLIVCIASQGYCALNPDDEVTVVKEFKHLVIGQGRPFLMRDGEKWIPCDKDGNVISESKFAEEKAKYVAPKTQAEINAELREEIALLKAR